RLTDQRKTGPRKNGTNHQGTKAPRKKRRWKMLFSVPWCLGGGLRVLELFRASAANSDVPDAEDLVLLGTAGRQDLGDVAGVLADQGAGDRRADRDLAVLDVRFVFADDLVDDRLAAVQIGQLHGRSEDATTVRIETRRIDDLGVGKLGFQFQDAA